MKHVSSNYLILPIAVGVLAAVGGAGDEVRLHDIHLRHQGTVGLRGWGTVAGWEMAGGRATVVWYGVQ